MANVMKLTRLMTKSQFLALRFPHTPSVQDFNQTTFELQQAWMEVDNESEPTDSPQVRVAVRKLYNGLADVEQALEFYSSTQIAALVLALRDSLAKLADSESFESLRESVGTFDQSDDIVREAKRTSREARANLSRFESSDCDR